MSEDKKDGTYAGKDKFNRDMYWWTCSSCKQKCQVPFKPREGRPIKCSKCYWNDKKKY